MSGNQSDGAGEERLLREAARLLRERAEALEPTTADRLRRARQRALAEFDRRGSRQYRIHWGWRPAAAALLVVALCTLLWPGGMPGPRQDPAPEAPAARVSGPDLELMLAEEDLALLEDLEFLDWLDVGMPEGAALDAEASG